MVARWHKASTWRLKLGFGFFWTAPPARKTRITPGMPSAKVEHQIRRSAGAVYVRQHSRRGHVVRAHYRGVG